MQSDLFTALRENNGGGVKPVIFNLKKMKLWILLKNPPFLS